MALFGSTSKSSTSNTSTQQGVEGSGLIVSDQASVIYQFPDSVADLANKALELAAGAAGSATQLAQGTQATLGTIAEREKTPLTEWLPVIAVGAAALVAVAYIFGRN